MDNLKRALCLLVLLCLSACSDELKNKPAAKASGNVLALKTADVKAVYDGDPEQNAYHVTISWPKADGSVRISESQKILAVLPGTNLLFVHTPVQGGSHLSYLIEHLTVDGRIVSSFPIFIDIPLDIFIDGELRLTDNQKIEADRVFLSPRAHIITEDKSLTIITKDFFSDNANIENFLSNEAASWEQTGRAGGAIAIQADHAQGSLEVNLSGEGGGHGKNGVITFPGRHPGCAGTGGGNGGNTGSLQVNIKDGESLNVNYIMSPGPRGIAGGKGVVPANTPNAIYPPCDRDTPNGIDGNDGNKGQACLKLSEATDYVCH